LKSEEEVQVILAKIELLKRQREKHLKEYENNKMQINRIANKEVADLERQIAEYERIIAEDEELQR